MKKLLLVISAIGLMTISNAQQFSFQMKFIDIVGNRDSLTLGYDNTATDTLDLAFGETNIISTPYTTGLNVRAGNVWFQQNSFLGFGQTAFETKTQIVPNICGTGNFWLIFPVAEINIVTTHFPVKAYWNHTLFNNTCRNGSVFTSIHPGGWWDTGGFRDELNSMDSTTFYKNQYYFLNGSDTVNVYWVALSDSTLLSIGINELTTDINSIRIFPNPASDFITISLSKSFGDINRVEFINLVGQTVKTSNQLSNINIGDLPIGLYFIQVINNRGIKMIVKIQKI
jgi:hypothetical protein